MKPQELIKSILLNVVNKYISADNIKRKHKTLLN